MANSTEHSMPAATGLSEDRAVDDVTFLVDVKNPDPIEKLEDNVAPQDLRDKNLVDVKSFKVLINLQDMVENNFVTLNASMTNLTKVVKIYMMRPPAFAGQGPSSGKVPPRAPTLLASQGPLPMGKVPSMPSTSRDGDEFLKVQLKNVQTREYKGMEKDCNKDTVHTFLQKWVDIHCLGATPDRGGPLETSISLKDKAFKWWMVMDYDLRPKSWRELQDVFCKEFLPQNEKQEIR